MSTKKIPVFRMTQKESYHRGGEWVTEPMFHLLPEDCDRPKSWEPLAVLLDRGDTVQELKPTGRYMFKTTKTEDSTMYIEATARIRKVVVKTITRTFVTREWFRKTTTVKEGKRSVIETHEENLWVPEWAIAFATVFEEKEEVFECTK